jgi:hypothetical protein
MKELILVLRQHESIHNEDMDRAIVKKLRSGKTIESAADHMVLDGIATTFREGREPDDDQREWIARRFDKKMAQRIAKAARSPRETFSPVQMFALSTWRQIEVCGKQLPGLRHWKSSAAVVLLQEARMMRKDALEQDYNSLVFDLGLERGEVLISSLARNAKREWVVI